METVRESVQSKCSEETEHLALIAASRAGGIPAPLARPFPCDEEHYLLLSWTLAKGSAILDDH